MAKNDASQFVTDDRVREPDMLTASENAPLAPFKQFGRRVFGRSVRPIDVVETPEPRTAVRARPSAYLISFFVFVAAPAFAVILYFAIFASDQFVAEVRFAVTAAHSESLTDKLKSALSSGGVPSMSGQDAYIVAAYIRSRAIIDDVSKTVDLKEMFRRPEGDFWARLKANPTAEELTDYWRSMVSAYVDPPSGIVTVTVRAFRPADALAISNAILTVSEALANDVSARSRSDTMKLAETEVRRAEARVVANLEDLRAFRDSTGLIDPIQQATATGVLLTELMTQKIKLQDDYFVASHAMSLQAPTVQSLKLRLDTIDQQIAEQKAKLTGSSTQAGTIASLLPKYEQLELESTFAEKLYTLAQDGLDRARQRAQAQSIYVSVFVPPALPEEAKFPERISVSIVTTLVLLVLWGIGALAGALVEDHRI